MPSAINKLMVAELTRKFREMPSALLVDYTGLSAPEADGLRAKLCEQGGGMMIIKNSLASLALRELKLDALSGLLDGPVAFVYGEDPVLLTRTVREWRTRQHEMVWRGAVIEGEVVGPDVVGALASMPPLLVLRAQVVGAIAAPLTGFVGALQAVVRNFAAVVKAIAEKKEKEG